MWVMNFDKYELYTRAVQSPEEDVNFLLATFKKLTGRKPITLGEDFCGTFALCCEWIRRGSDLRAVGVDLSLEPLTWGRTHHLSRLDRDQQSRLLTLNGNVMDLDLPPVDLLAAMNFSYFIFKRRDDLVAYFRNVRKRLTPGGLFFADCFGGTDISDDVEEEIDHDDFLYFWHQERSNPITNEGLFHIHFQLKNQEKFEKVFTYDWRMWSIPEIREAMLDAGFRSTRVMWETADSTGDGTGDFYETYDGESCASWIAYVIGET
jgi:SAM-dependent methyltransferase